MKTRISIVFMDYRVTDDSIVVLIDNGLPNKMIVDGPDFTLDVLAIRYTKINPHSLSFELCTHLWNEETNTLELLYYCRTRIADKKKGEWVLAWEACREDNERFAAIQKCVSRAVQGGVFRGIA